MKKFDGVSLGIEPWTKEWQTLPLAHWASLAVAHLRLCFERFKYVFAF